MTAPRRESTWVAARVVATPRPRTAVLTAAEAAARDARAIADGVPSRALMRVAGYAAASELSRRYAGRLSRGVVVFAGPGNNGGDAWVVAGALGAAGVSVRVVEAAPPATEDAKAEKARALPVVLRGAPSGAERLVVDGLLGIGARPVHEGPLAAAIADINARRLSGATVVSLDLPSGLSADDGTAAHVVSADCTLTFGGVKRGLLLRRELAGTIVALDIGLGHSPDDSAALVDAPWVRHVLPDTPASAHKGTRGTVVVAGGAAGMAGAVVLAARAALSSGAGLVQVLAEAAALPQVTAAVPSALARAWPSDVAEAAEALAKADAVIAGPGLGLAAARAMVERLAAATTAPLVLDADALTAFAGDVPALRALAAGRAVCTPHPGEAARLVGRDAGHVNATRFDTAQALADAIGAPVLLKGVPTVIAQPGAPPMVVARGTPALATGGSGDVLAGILATLLAQGMAPAEAAAVAAWGHGVAAERAGMQMPLRGVTLDDVLVALPTVWAVDDAASLPPVLAELPAIPA
jgi:ADP-dependent NAD(P)H-hydrate dehydratase / NAD(P)H-hydrate epimerase